MKKLLFFSTLTFLAVIYSYADEVVWTGAAGDNQWHTPANWSTGQLPNLDDNVTIPNGTPVCRAYGYGWVQPRAGTLNNYGNLEFHGCDPVINNFNNSNNVIIQGTSDQSAVEFKINSEGSFNNEGTFSSSGHCELRINGPEASFSNSGTLHITHFNANLNSFENTIAGNLSSDNCSNQPDLIITCNSDFVNEGLIEGEPGIYGTGTGINISAQNVTNNGYIYGGNALTHNNDGGSITITANNLLNGESGKIRGGNGLNSAIHHGEVNINTGVTTNYGFIAAGRTREKSNHEESAGEIYFNNVFTVADSIKVHGDSTGIEADTLTFIFNYLKISDILSFASIYSDELIEFRGTYGAVADLSDNDVSGILFVAKGAISFYCDNIISPPEGLNWLCSTFPEVYPSDTNYTRAFISGSSVFDTAGGSGVFRVLLQNQSTADKSFDYSIFSSKGWVTPMNGATQTLAPFQFDTLQLSYNIPPAADTLIDTVTQVLNVPGVFSETVFSYINSSSGQIVGMNDHQANAGFKLFQNYPNPFQDKTWITFCIDWSSQVTLKVYDACGHEIAILTDSELESGEHEIIFNGGQLPSGMYYYAIYINDFIDIRKMILSH